jgi:serine/threonine protein kinase
VIKSLNEDMQRSPDFIKLQQDFVNEALRLRGCQHWKIVRVYELFQEGYLWYMVMEYISGTTLWDHVIFSGYLKEEEALQYIKDIGEALTVVHQNGIIHRDLNPKNIMIQGYTAKLIDFGLAREFTLHQMQSQTVAAFPGFAPLEQYSRQGKRGPYTDIYGLASALYYALTGVLPISAPDRAVGQYLQNPSYFNPSISYHIEQAIIKGMALDPRDRPQSVRAWLRLLKDRSSRRISKKDYNNDYTNF